MIFQESTAKAVLSFVFAPDKSVVTEENVPGGGRVAAFTLMIYPGAFLILGITRFFCNSTRPQQEGKAPHPRP